MTQLNFKNPYIYIIKKRLGEVKVNIFQFLEFLSFRHPSDLSISHYSHIHPKDKINFN